MDQKKVPLKKNFGIIAHVDAGKTTLTERILLFAKKIFKTGEVHHGEATMDWMSQERERGITIQSAATFFDWDLPTGDKVHLNLIDTPGHVDFTLEVERSLRILDAAVIVLDSVEGVEPQTRTVWEQSVKHKVGVSFFINKLDRMGASFEDSLQSLRENFNINPCPLVITFAEDIYSSYNLLENTTYSWDKKGNFTVSPGVDEAKVGDYKKMMLDALSEVDESFVEDVVEGNWPSREKIVEALKLGLPLRKIFPVLSGAALKNIGVQPLINHIGEIFPETETFLQEEGSLKALVFKVQKLPNVGLIYYLKIFRGSLLKGDKLYNLSLGKRFRINRLVRMHAINLEEVESASKGDIVAVTGIEAKTGDTLSISLGEEALFSIDIPEAVMSLSVFPATKSNSDIEKMNEELRLLILQDPSLRILEGNNQQKILSGMGELHLQVATTTLEEACKFKIDTSKPQVEYKSTFKKERDIVYTYKKQSGGSGLWARVMIKFIPIEDGEIIFEDKISGEGIPSELRPSVGEGIRYEASVGIGKFPPITRFKAVLYDGMTHPVDSNKRAFEMAGRFSLREAAGSEDSIDNLKVLEPIMLINIITVEDLIGRVSGDISNRRGSIIEVVREEKKGYSSKTKVHITAEAPLGELFNYISHVRSLTSGEVSVVYSFHKYGFLPSHLVEKIFD